jgi:hypothetical protein
MRKPNSKQSQPGDQFNDLTILHLSHIDKRKRRFYKCKCKCGNVKIVHGGTGEPITTSTAG